MTDIVQQRDIAATRLGTNATPLAAIVAGAGSNGAAVTGVTIDRTLFGLMQVAVFSMVWEANLAATKTLSLAGLKVEDSADGATWATYTPPPGTAQIVQPGVVGTGPAGGGVVRGNTGQEFYLGAARRYVRFDFTPTLSNTTTDTASIMVHGSFGGFSHVPGG